MNRKKTAPNYRNRKIIIDRIKGMDLYLLANFLEAEEQLKIKIAKGTKANSGIHYIWLAQRYMLKHFQQY